MELGWRCFVPHLPQVKKIDKEKKAKIKALRKQAERDKKAVDDDVKEQTRQIDVKTRQKRNLVRDERDAKEFMCDFPPDWVPKWWPAVWRVQVQRIPAMRTQTRLHTHAHARALAHTHTHTRTHAHTHTQSPGWDLLVLIGEARAEKSPNPNRRKQSKSKSKSADGTNPAPRATVLRMAAGLAGNLGLSAKPSPLPNPYR